MRLVVGMALVRGGGAQGGGGPDDRQLLAAQRRGPGPLAGLWELPGGKVEPGEDPEGALGRELQEELGLVVGPQVELGPRLGDDLLTPDGSIRLRFWSGRLLVGEPAALVHAELRWLTAAELTTVRWLPGDEPLLPALAALLQG